MLSAHFNNLYFFIFSEDFSAIGLGDIRRSPGRGELEEPQTVVLTVANENRADFSSTRNTKAVTRIQSAQTFSVPCVNGFLHRGTA